MNTHILRYTITDADGNTLFDSTDSPQSAPRKTRRLHHARSRPITMMDQGGHLIDRTTIAIAGAILIIAPITAIYLT